MALLGDLDELVQHARVQTKLLQLILETINSQVNPEKRGSPYNFSKLTHEYSDNASGDMLDREQSTLWREVFVNKYSEKLIWSDEMISRQQDSVLELHEKYEEQKDKDE